MNLTNDKQYRVRARTTDLAANGPTIQSVIFTYDIEKPTSTITNLVSGYVGSLTIVAGTATDDPSGALQYESKLGTSTIGVAIYSVTDGQWWDSDLVDFQSAVPIYYEVANATGTNPNTWTYTFPGPLAGSFVDGRSYRFVPRAVDLAGNAEFASNVAPAGVGVTVTLDENPPTLTITKPVDATPADDTSPRISTVTTGGGISYPLINGTVTDGSGPGNGIQKVQVRVWKSDPARYWNPGASYSPSAFTMQKNGQRHGVVSGAFDDELDDVVRDVQLSDRL